MSLGSSKPQASPGAQGGAVLYRGTWNAATNVPVLTSGLGTAGDYYIVSTDGTTNLDGITDWYALDWAVFNGATWQKVDNTETPEIVNEIPTGAVDGSNKVFTLSKAPLNTGVFANTLKLYVDGIRYSDADWTLSGTTLTVSAAATPTSEIVVDYFY